MVLLREFDGPVSHHLLHRDEVLRCENYGMHQHSCNVVRELRTCIAQKEHVLYVRRIYAADGQTYQDNDKTQMTRCEQCK